MKTVSKFIFFSTLFCISFTACKQEEKIKQKPILGKTIVVDWETCSDSAAYESHRIKNHEGVSSLQQYKTYIDRVKDTLTKTSLIAFPNMDDKLNYGSEVDFNVLLEVLSHRKYACSDKLFLMNAMRPKIVDGKPSKDEIVAEILFVIESKDEKGNPTYTYFDFTRPCPNGCPKSIPDLEYPN